MKILKTLFTAAMSLTLASFVNLAVAADEAPDALVKRISTEVLEGAKADKEIQNGNQKHVLDLVEAKIAVCRFPTHDFAGGGPLLARRHARAAKAIDRTIPQLVGIHVFRRDFIDQGSEAAIPAV